MDDQIPFCGVGTVSEWMAVVNIVRHFKNKNMEVICQSHKAVQW